MFITLTFNSIKHIIKCLKNKKYPGIFLEIKKSGCSGMSYKIKYADIVKDKICVFKNSGISIFIKPEKILYIQNSKIDYFYKNFKDGFKIFNPNEKSICGCGESFFV